MGETMQPTNETKKGNLRLVRGALADQRELTPDEWLEREARSLMASWKGRGGNGPYASRGIANAVHGINHPHRIIARRMREAHEQRVRHELVRRFGQLLEEYADRLYRVQNTGNSQPPRAA